MQSDPQEKKSSHAEREERILKLWKDKDIFRKSLEKPSPKGDFTFYDGPPFATGSPHYGHILAGTMKDAIPRFRTMQGYRVRRRWGWDCHGLPVENLVEKELGLQTKKDILAYGIGRFNDKARESVMRFTDEWREIVPRLGRWVDMDDDYRTMDASYTETVWWIFRELHDKGLIYEGFKSMNLCPRCETTLSNFEVAQGYKDITDISAYVKFELVDDPGVYFLAWTTTPWTLPGNVALAVNPSIDYVKIKLEDPPDEKKGTFILAKARLSILMDLKYSVLETISGSKLVSKAYKPMFTYYSGDSKLKNRENGWKVYAADFVTTEDGTGIVHIAPAFGADDYDLSLKYKLPFVQHVAVDGTFKKEATDFAGKHVKPKDTDQDKTAHQSGDIEVIKWLAHHGFLFEKEKLAHSYPHCWRCETPLLNYAASSWFVKVTDLKNKLVAENKKISWVPPTVGSARFGNWLEGARDWAISRTRFWGAPIPVWREEDSGACHILGSVADLKRFSRAKNTYYVMRHGEADNNVSSIINSGDRNKVHLTARGREQVEQAAAGLNGTRFDAIYVSPFARTRETAEIVAKALGISGKDIYVEERLHEFNTGAFDNQPLAKMTSGYPVETRFDRKPEGGESYADIKKRAGDFLYELEQKHQGKTILLVTHETPACLLIAAASGLNQRQSLDMKPQDHNIKNAEVHKLDFSPLPHNDRYELDLHRPFIDELDLRTPEGKKLMRVPDVFDCWFESGSMPYGEAHYPFEHLDEFDPKPGLFRKPRGYPADFIAEGLDQTRGWFYSMLVLGTALFGKSPYKSVIVNGLVLAEDGEKMSKSKKNYPDPMEVVDRYGADALRYYLMSSPVVHGEDLCFSEKGVDEVTKKIVNRLLNVVSFYEMYAGDEHGDSQNVLDRWILSRLNETVSFVTKGLEGGELDRAARPLLDFTDDLSTWYLRRSRDRFKGDNVADRKAALATTRFALLETAKLIAPFMPFLAEEVYKRVKGLKESVHLEEWPREGRIDGKLLNEMEVARSVASKALEARSAAKINIRQPLSSFSTVMEVASLDLIRLIEDEVNVKKVTPKAASDKLDTEITPELKEEGDLRELLRKIQDLRKEKGLSVKNKAVFVATNDLKDLISSHEQEIKSATNLSGIEYGEALGLK